MPPEVGGDGLGPIGPPTKVSQKEDGLPKVTITYADHLDLEESVMNVSEKELPSSRVLANAVNSSQEQGQSGRKAASKQCNGTSSQAKKANKGFSTAERRLAHIISPMEVIEECSIENSQTDEPTSHQTPLTSHSNKS